MKHLNEVVAEWLRLRDQWPELRRWTLEIDRRSKVRCGVCRYHKREVAVSAWLLERGLLDEAIDTLRHEAAHALAGRVGHGAKWKEWCVRIGARPERCAPTELYEHIELRYRAVCPTHGEIRGYTRRPRWATQPGRKAWCRKCKSPIHLVDRAA